MNRGPHPHKAQRDRARRITTKLGHRLDRFRGSTLGTWSYAVCRNRGCGLSVHIDENGMTGNILEVECHAVTFG